MLVSYRRIYNKITITYISDLRSNAIASVAPSALTGLTESIRSLFGNKNSESEKYLISPAHSTVQCPAIHLSASLDMMFGQAKKSLYVTVLLGE